MKAIIEIKDGVISGEVLNEKPVVLPPNDTLLFCVYGEKSENTNYFQSLINRFYGRKVLKEDGEYGPQTDKFAATMFVEMGLPYDKKVTESQIENIHIKIKNSDPSPDSLTEKYNKALHLEILKKFAFLGWKEGVGSKAWKMFQEEWKNYGYSATNWAWCATSQHELLDQAGLNLPYAWQGMTYALVGTFKQWGKWKGFYKTSNPKPADLFIVGGAAHIGAIIGVDGNSIITSEGNSKDSYRSVIRKKSSVTGYIEIPDGFTFHSLKS